MKKKYTREQFDKMVDETCDEYADMLRKILNHYGVYHQIMKCIEELGELQCALARHIAGDERYTIEQRIDNIKEEVADVMFMMEQLSEAFGYDEVQEIRARKLVRTLTNIETESKGDV